MRNKEETGKAKKKLEKAERHASIRKILNWGSVFVGIGIVVLVGSSVIFYLEQKSIENEELRQEQIAAQKEQQQQEAYKRIADTFNANKAEIIAGLESLIDQKKFDTAEKEIMKYDIPSLAADLSDTKSYLTETKLNEKAKVLPATDIEENFRVYNQLLILRSDSSLYREKQQYYKLKLANKKYEEAKSYFQKEGQYSSELNRAIDAIDKAVMLNPDMTQYRELRRRLKNEGLKFYKGNASVLMAVADKGVVFDRTYKSRRFRSKRCLYVWIKNVSSRPFHVNPNDFTLICEDNRSYHYNDSNDGLLVDLQPGTRTGGHIYFQTDSEPKELVYSNVTAGRISSVIP